MTKNNEKLTMRDQFAIGALAALCGGSWNGTVCSFVANDEYRVSRKLAVSAYKIADEMLNVRDCDLSKENFK